jgi:hypothetical protein
MLEPARNIQSAAADAIAVEARRRGRCAGITWTWRPGRWRSGGLTGQGAIPKTARSRRTLKLPQIALSELPERRAAQAADRLKAGKVWQDSGLVFTTSAGTMLDQHNIRREFRQITKAAGLGED